MLAVRAANLGMPSSARSVTAGVRCFETPIFKQLPHLPKIPTALAPMVDMGGLRIASAVVVVHSCVSGCMVDYANDSSRAAWWPAAKCLQLGGDVQCECGSARFASPSTQLKQNHAHTPSTDEGRLVVVVVVLMMIMTPVALPPSKVVRRLHV